jgi:hypothetical protein
VEAKGHDAAICDANVLIDYMKADPDILRELVAYWGQVYVPDIVLAEVEQLPFTLATELGLSIIETPLSLPMRSGLSVQDRACLHFVMQNKWTCIANDRLLRSECIKAGGAVAWGMEMLVCLVSSGRITQARARDIGKKIHSDNPLITRDILESFQQKLNEIRPG